MLTKKKRPVTAGALVVGYGLSKFAGNKKGVNNLAIKMGKTRTKTL